MSDLWAGRGKPHDSSCLLCFRTPVDLDCSTCERSYHSACIEEDFPIGPEDNAWCCPLCMKRSWNEIPPTKKGNERVYAMAYCFAHDSTYLQQLQASDDGSLFSDHQLLTFLRKIRCARRTVDEQVEDSAIGKPFWHSSTRASTLALINELLRSGQEL